MRVRTFILKNRTSERHQSNLTLTPKMPLLLNPYLWEGVKRKKALNMTTGGRAEARDRFLQKNVKKTVFCDDIHHLLNDAVEGRLFLPRNKLLLCSLI